MRWLHADPASYYVTVSRLHFLHLQVTWWDLRDTYSSQVSIYSSSNKDNVQLVPLLFQRSQFGVQFDDSWISVGVILEGELMKVWRSARMTAWRSAWMTVWRSAWMTV